MSSKDVWISCLKEWWNIDEQIVDDINNKTKVFRADLLDLDLDLDLDFEDIIRFGNISVLITFQFWWQFSFDDITVLVTIQF